MINELNRGVRNINVMRMLQEQEFTSVPSLQQIGRGTSLPATMTGPRMYPEQLPAKQISRISLILLPILIFYMMNFVPSGTNLCLCLMHRLSLILSCRVWGHMKVTSIPNILRPAKIDPKACWDLAMTRVYSLPGKVKFPTKPPVVFHSGHGGSLGVHQTPKGLDVKVKMSSTRMSWCFKSGGYFGKKKHMS